MRFALLLLIIGSGILLRVWSVGYNDRIQGDVNLMTLTAEEVYRSGRVHYPIKYDFSSLTTFGEFKDPATQHPPLWPLLGTALRLITPAGESYLALQSLSFLAGVAVWLIASLRLAPLLSNEASLGPVIILAGLSPLLVDFSGNGSPYIAAALVLVFFTELLLRQDLGQARFGLIAGILSGTGAVLHGALSLLPLAFLAAALSDAKRRKVLVSAAFLFGWLILLLPYITWTYFETGRLFYSYSSYHVLGKLGLLSTVVSQDRVVLETNLDQLSFSVLVTYLGLVGKGALSGLLSLGRELGPFGLVLLLAGAYGLRQRSKRVVWLVLLPIVAYTAAPLLWAGFKYRFLVPLFPVVLVICGVGYGTLERSSTRLLKQFAKPIFLGFLLWSIWGFWDEPPTRYYPNDSDHPTLYSEMKEASAWLAAADPGVVLGVSSYLDGGIETAVWHDKRFVAARGFRENCKALQVITYHYQVSYFWSDNRANSALKECFPALEVLHRSGRFLILAPNIVPRTL